jgi:hypothetical protein
VSCVAGRRRDRSPHRRRRSRAPPTSEGRGAYCCWWFAWFAVSVSAAGRPCATPRRRPRAPAPRPRLPRPLLRAATSRRRRLILPHPIFSSPLISSATGVEVVVDVRTANAAPALSNVGRDLAPCEHPADGAHADRESPGQRIDAVERLAEPLRDCGGEGLDVKRRDDLRRNLPGENVADRTTRVLPVADPPHDRVCEGAYVHRGEPLLRRLLAARHAAPVSPSNRAAER